MTTDHTCPTCGQRMLMRHGAYMPPIPASIFDMIEHSGERGVPMQVLADVFFPNKPSRDARNCVRVHVNRINDFLASTDFRVEMRDRPHGAYRVHKEPQ